MLLALLYSLVRSLLDALVPGRKSDAARSTGMLLGLTYQLVLFALNPVLLRASSRLIG